MTIDYIKLSPTQNITVLVRTPVPRARQADIAARLLADEGVGGEQVGYVEPAADPRARARLQMMGGEFCGNAAMSLGAVLAGEADLADGGVMDMLIEVSGSDGPVPCRICRHGDAWTGTVHMPLPTRIGEAALETDAGTLSVPLVEMPGVAHLILPASAGLDESDLRRRLPEWSRALGADALGALTWHEDTAYLDPLVHVPSAGTLVREHGCGSGSAAIGCWLSARADRGGDFAIHQPGGTIVVRVETAGGALRTVTITGRVELIGRGTAHVGDGLD